MLTCFHRNGNFLLRCDFVTSYPVKAKSSPITLWVYCGISTRNRGETWWKATILRKTLALATRRRV